MAILPGAAASAADRRAVRIALAMALALCVAELDPDRVQLSFLAPLVAAALGTAPPAPLAVLLALPILAWLLAIAAGLVLQLLHGLPLAMGALLFGIFLVGFRASCVPRLAVPSVLLLIFFAILPMVLIRAPELAEDTARWFALNIAIACASVLLTRALLPDPPMATAAPPPGRRPAPLPPAAAAAALLLAMVLVAVVQPQAQGALLISVVLSLRADGSPPEEVIRNRFGAAIIGGGAAWLSWEVVWYASSLPVLFATTLLVAWLLARRFVAGGPYAGIWLKSLNAYAILLGEGFSPFFEPTDERLGIRIGGVFLGVAYAALMLWLLRPGAGRAAAARPG